MSISTPAASRTPPPASARTPAGRPGPRRGRRWVAGVAVVLVVAVGVVLAVVPGSPVGRRGPASGGHAGLRIVGRSGAAVELASDTAPSRPRAGAGVETDVATAEEAFSLALLRQINTSGAADANVVASPSSLATVLAMLEVGARGSTAAQIAAALGTSSLSGARQAAGWRALGADETAAARRAGIDLTSADSLWTQTGLPLGPGFMSEMSGQFAAGVWQTDFRGHPDQAAAALNSWVDTQTHGLITRLFDPGVITPMTALVLANAVYFNGRWQTVFDAAKTVDGTFHAAGDASVSVPFMTLSAPLRMTPLTITDLGDTSGTPESGGAPPYEAVELPYKGGRFAALVVMPTTGTLADFVNGLTPSSFGRIVGGLRRTGAVLSLPRFQLTDAHDLNGVLESMGVRDIFGPADLTGLSPTPLVVQQVEQRAFLKVDESGTKAAAATGVATATAAPLAVTIDRPFLFLVRDMKTGAVLFESEVENPSR
jgi:serpin B